MLHAECTYDIDQRLVGQPETNYRNYIKQGLKLFGIKGWRVSVLYRKARRANWTRKYSVRHEILKSVGKGSAGITDKKRKIDAILINKKTVSIPESFNASIARRIYFGGG